MNCSLCNKSIDQIYFNKKKSGLKYYKCVTCDFIFLDSQYYLKSEQEHKHYLRHNNDIEDPRYQEFVMPLVEIIEANTTNEEKALDYGCGPGPVVAHLLEKKGYHISLYDLFFKKNEDVLKISHDFIILSEVAEHFQNPLEAFDKLKRYLKPGGKIFIMTALTDHLKDFASWHYHRDPTHVSFYSTKAFEVLSKKLGFDIIDNDKKKCIALKAK